MYDLFNDRPVYTRVDYVNLSLDYARKELIKDTETWITYRRMNPDAIQSDHLLVKILQGLNIEYAGDLYRYRSLVDQRVQQFSGILGLTSGFYKGKLFTPGVFYGEGCHEAIIASDEDWDMTDPEENWMEWEPIRVLSHPRSDLGIESLDGKGSFSELGYAVISINISMLACQYQMWKQSDQSGDEEFSRNSRQFVLMYPLTNAIRSHLDIALFNRLCRRWYNEPFGKSYRRLPIHTTDLTTRFDGLIRDIIDRLYKQRYDFKDILKIIPGVYREWSLDVHQLPKMFVANQCLWTLYLARLNVIGFLVNFNRTNSNQRNTAEITRIKRSLIEAKSGKWLINGHPTHLVKHYDETITDRILPYL